MLLMIQFFYLFSWKIQTPFNPCTTFHFSHNPLPLLRTVFSTKMEMWNSRVITHFNQMTKKSSSIQKSMSLGTTHITLKKSNHSKYRLIEKKGGDWGWIAFINLWIQDEMWSFKTRFINKSKQFKLIDYGSNSSEALPSDFQLMSSDSFSSSTPLESNFSPHPWFFSHPIPWIIINPQS